MYSPFEEGDFNPQKAKQLSSEKVVEVFYITRGICLIYCGCGFHKIYQNRPVYTAQTVTVTVTGRDSF